MHKTQVMTIVSKSFEDRASYVEGVFKFYVNVVLEKCYVGSIEVDALGSTSEEDKMCNITKIIHEFWGEELKMKFKEEKSLWRAIFRTVGWSRLIRSFLLYAACNALQFGPPLILNILVQYFEDDLSLTVAYRYTLVFMLFFIPTVNAILQSNVIKYHSGLQARNALIDLIYRKSLRMSTASRKDVSNGLVVNMFSNDTAQILRSFSYIDCVLVAPLLIVTALYLIYLQVGAAVFVGIGLVVLMIPVTITIFYFLNLFRAQKISATDHRVSSIGEMLNGIRVIKLQAWERAFEKKVSAIRAEELAILRNMARTIAIGFTFSLTGVPIFLPVLVFYTYIQLGNVLTAATAFTTLALFLLLYYPFMSTLPTSFTVFSQAIVAMERIRTYLLIAEPEPYVSKSEKADGSVISMTGATLSWEESRKDIASSASSFRAAASLYGSVDIEVGDDNKLDVYKLSGVTFNVKRGELVAVVGVCGSGKSSLLSALLGEMLLESGQVQLAGSVAYCIQQPWILNATVQENILFGLPYDEERFYSAVFASSLESDLTSLSGGVNTQIGEKGINLSGGQKARVALARTMYQGADVYLLDDPLSAVDAHVAQVMFQECIKTALSKKTRILVTHNEHLLAQCDKILVLKDGQVSFFGTHSEMTSSQMTGNVADICHTFQSTSPQHSPYTKEYVRKARSASVERSHSRSQSREIQKSVVMSAAQDLHVSVELSEEGSMDENDQIHTGSLTLSQKRAAMEAIEEKSSFITAPETKANGDVHLSMYAYYMQAGGVWLYAVAGLFIVGSQIFGLLSTYELSTWGDATTDTETAGSELTVSESMAYFNVFAVWSSLSFLCFLFRALAIAEHRIYAADSLHANLLKSILSAPVSFFDVTPTGRVLNRFSSDVQSVDEDLSNTLDQATLAVSTVIGAVVGVAIATKGIMIALFIPVGYLFHYCEQYFGRANNQISRIVSVSRSPIYEDFSQMLSGLSSVRAYGCEDTFIQSLYLKVDVNSIAMITQETLFSWLLLRLTVLSAIVTCCIAALAIMTETFIPAGYLAVAMLYSLQLAESITLYICKVSILGTQINSVERIAEYTESIGHEEADDDDDEAANFTIVSPDWPKDGKIVFNHVELKYRDGPLVLKGLNFAVQPHEKLGVTGRTGSGKSSLMTGLFRIQEISGGSIVVDGVDIKTVPLTVLRSRLGIIPQEPVMFSATVRFNLDPLEQYSDGEVWGALHQVGMNNYVRDMPQQLLAQVAEGGESFSQGHRQLICIARAILRKPKILVLDEATASIDNETDAFIQRVVSEQFKDCTVLTIAHRLHTIIENDKILVLNDGLLAEFGTPSDLLANKEGVFRCLWEKHNS